MVAHKHQKRATPEEMAHLSQVAQLPCCNCPRQKKRTEVHHIVCGHRLGHFYVIPLCEDCHAQVHLLHAVEREYWERTNEKLGVLREWPVSKIVRPVLRLKR